MDTPLFPLGQVVATPGARNAAAEAGISLMSLVIRHVRGEQGDLCDGDHALNQMAILEGSRVFSSFDGFWVITEGDRSATTVLLPSEY